ncbi:MAG: class I SAM-dependent methyltransferase [Anaerolineales bacterium]|nr:class I SAM-dependent methyltransferase [Anaerolineales bacterium]
MLGSLIKRTAQNIFRWNEFSLEDVSETDNDILRGVKDYTMTSPERIFAVLEAVRYVLKSNLPGSIVECGVWRGGTMMAIARLLCMHERFDKELYLFDTFEGMTLPAEVDIDFRGRKARTLFLARKRTGDSSVWCYAPVSEVQANLETIGYPRGKVHCVVGKVEDTIPQHAPEEISILRLDTDWYESTKHELVHLFPRLVKGGVLIIDDYGHWQGARKAVDEYFVENKIPILLNRIDYTGRIAVKVQ